MLDSEKDGGSVRDELVAAFTARKDDATPGAEPKQPTEPAADKSVKTEVAEKADNVDKPKDDKATPDTEKPIDPPARWSKEEKEEFAALDPKIQKLLLNRNRGLESDYTKKMQEISAERTRFKAVDDVLAPRRNEWARGGLDDASALRMVFSYWDYASKDPAGFIQRFAQERGIDLAKLYAPSVDMAALTKPQVDAEGNPVASSVHPLVAQLLEQQASKIVELEGRLGQTHQLVQSREQYSLNEARQSAANEMASFAQATDDHGNPRYPFFEDVKADMAAMFAIHQGMPQHEVEARRKLTLSDAYDRAVYARPDIRSKLLESERTAWAAQERARRAKEAEKAKTAGSSVSASSSAVPAGSPTDTGKPRSLREELEAQFAAAGNRGRV